MGRNKGAIITTTLCKCGHEKIIHMPSTISSAEGHGACASSHCGCEKFTWTGYTTTFQVKDTKEAWEYWRKMEFKFL